MTESFDWKLVTSAGVADGVNVSNLRHSGQLNCVMQAVLEPIVVELF